MTDPIVDAVCAKLQSRSAVGLKKYGTTLADNAATVKEKLIHIQEELMDAANYVEWLLQDYSSYGVSPGMEAVKMMEKEMPTPMTIKMEVTKTPENVTCENLSDTDERQAALASLKSEYELNGSNPCNWFIRDYYNVLCAALRAPRVPDAMFKKLGSLIKAVDGRTFENDPHDAIIDAAIRTLSSPRVPAIDGLYEAILDLNNNVCGNGAISEYSENSLDTVMYAARAYAELQKGV